MTQNTGHFKRYNNMYKITTRVQNIKLEKQFQGSYVYIFLGTQTGWFILILTVQVKTDNTISGQ